MLWAALRLRPAPDSMLPSDDALRGLATWALQWTPRVAILEDAVVMELAASVRLFGGKRSLRNRVRDGSAELDVIGLAWAPNSLAALLLARAGIESGFRAPLDTTLDGIPMDCLSATGPHHTTLVQLGCRTLGDVRKLPRGGVSRRFDKELLAAMDRAYGLKPEAHEWVELPEVFKSRLELLSRVELAPALLFGARRLLVQLCGWLAARHCGTTAYTLRWAHDSMRSRHVGPGGELTIRTAEPTRDIEHLCRLLAENLAKVQLGAAVGELELEAIDVRSLHEVSDSLFPDPARDGESLTLVLERIAARLGPERVLRPVIVDDHRLEWMMMWQPAPLPHPRKRSTPAPAATPQPTFVLAAPLRLATRGPHPLYQGVLQLLVGPHRIEGGWWHRCVIEGELQSLNVARDYWVALSQHAGTLWIFQTRLQDEDDSAWFLHGIFA